MSQVTIQTTNEEDLTTQLNVPCTLTELNEKYRKTNYVVTSKYTWYSFFPKCIILQFKRFTNSYFLVMTMLMVLGTYGNNLFLTPYQPIGTLMVLMFVLMVTLVFEGSDDVKRHRADRETNKSPVTLLRRDEHEKYAEPKIVTWGELLPGDVIEVSNRHMIPADIVLLDTSSNGRCYIETSGIDGETNLKIKDVSSGLKTYFKDNGGWDTSFKGKISYETPNSLLQFTGVFIPQGAPENEKIALDFGGLILRGSQLRNTASIIGMVAYAGHETKLVMSKKDTPSKFSLLDKSVNRMMWISMVIYVIMTFLCDILLVFVFPSTEDWWYFKFTSSVSEFAIPGWLAYFFTFAILFSNIVPIDIVVCIEMANFMQGIWIQNDLKMYHEESDTCADVKTTNLVADLGQITHVFSDKTGTLTQNVMRLVACSIGNRMYGFSPPTEIEMPQDEDFAIPEANIRNRKTSKNASTLDINVLLKENSTRINKSHSNEYRTRLRQASIDLMLPQNKLFSGLVKALGNEDEEEQARKIADYLTLLAVCHTVVIDHDENGEIRYNAEGPDEEALVSAAATMGVKLLDTDDQQTTIEIEHGKYKGVHKYTVLAVNDFTSARKRMSVVVRCNFGETETLSVLAKGADNVMFKLLAQGHQPCDRDILDMHLDAYARNGLRTLVMGKRDMTEAEYAEWKPKLNEALTLTGEARGKAKAEVANLVEKDFLLLGASAIEDKLQDGVADTIKTIRNAGVTLWVLTGDKIETAINIAFSAKLLDKDMYQFQLVGRDQNQLLKEISDLLELLQAAANETQDENMQSPRSTFQRLQSMATMSEMFMKTHFIAEGLALVVSGDAIKQLLVAENGTRETEAKFLELLKSCKVVLGCRVSPAQKSLIVELIANQPLKSFETAPVTLAIGDGANDVPMIQQARVGIGISGKEGLQAVNSADFSIAQFRFLARLMLVHGRWNYRRNVAMVRYVTYSWMVLTYILFVYLFYTLMSGQQVYYETLFVTAFAWVCHISIVGFSWCDRDIRYQTALRFPDSYVNGRLNLDFGVNQVVLMCLRALVHAMFICVAFIWMLPYTANQDELGSAIYTGLVFAMTVRQGFIVTTYTWVVVFGFVCGLVVYFVAMGMFGPQVFTRSGAAITWTETLFVCIAIVIIEYIFVEVPRLIWPSNLDVLTELDRGYIYGKRKTPMAALDIIHVLGETARHVALDPFVIPAKHLKQVFNNEGISRRISHLKAFTHRSAFDFAAVSRADDETRRVTPPKSRWRAFSGFNKKKKKH